MLVEISSDRRTGRLRMEACPLCGAAYGEDYKQYSSHLRAEHGPEDLGLGRPLR